jgi:hypothetical protein
VGVPEARRMTRRMHGSSLPAAARLGEARW